MEAFPSLLERTVASALLLLSRQPPSLSPPLSESDSDESEKNLSNSKSFSSNFLERERNFSEKSLELTNSKLCASIFPDYCSEKTEGLISSKSSSHLTVLDNDLEKSVGLSNSKSSSSLSIHDDGADKRLELSNSKSSSCLSILDNGSEKSVGLSNSKSSSCLSSLTLDDGSSAETRAHRLRVVASVACCHEMKLKVVRKSRTQIMRKSDPRKRISCEKMMSEASTTMSEDSSCLSSGSSRGNVVVSSVSKPPINSASIRSRAEGILRVLSYGCASEVRIRQLLGDSPDTSKALRILLKKEQIRRSGIGGRGDPYIYMIA